MSSIPQSVTTRSRYVEPLLLIVATVIALLGGVAIGATGYDYAIVGAVIMLATGGAILLYPHLGVYILVVFIYANLSAIVETRTGFADANKYLVGLIFIGTFARRIMMEKKPIVFDLTELSILLFGTVIIISVLFAPVAATGELALVVDWLKDFAIILIILQFATEETVWKRAQWLLIFTATVLSLFSIYQTVTGDFQTEFFGLAKGAVYQVTEDLDRPRPTGPIEDPNFYAMFLLMVLPLAIYRFFTSQSRNAQVTGMVCSTVIFLALLFTYSRGAFVALIAVSVLMALERGVKLYKVVLLAALGVLIALPLLPTGFSERITTITDIVNLSPRSQTELSLRGRSSEAIVAYQMFMDYPLLGIGNGNYGQYYLDYSSKLGIDPRYEQREAHNLYLEIAAETGVLGSIAFVSMLAFLFSGMHFAKRTLREIDRDDLVGWVHGVQFGLLGFLFASLFLHSDYFRYFWLIVAFAATCRIVALSQKVRQSNSQIAFGFSPNTQV